MRVLAFKPNPRKPEQGFVRLTEMVDVQTDDGRKEQVEGEIIEAWTPEIAKAAELVGKELPADWTLRDGPKGKQLLPPREGRGGGGGSYRNTKEAFDAEQISIHASVALQQAVIWAQPVGNVTAEATLILADEFYKWLRKSVSEGPRLTRAISAAGGSLIERDAQGPPSDTISGEVPDPLQSTEGALPDDRREGDAAVKPEEAGGSPSRRQRCLHTEGIKTVTKETGGAIDVCVKCGLVMNI
jgi:hypothetical protein